MPATKVFDDIFIDYADPKCRMLEPLAIDQALCTFRMPSAVQLSAVGSIVAARCFTRDDGASLCPGSNETIEGFWARVHASDLSRCRLLLLRELAEHLN